MKKALASLLLITLVLATCSLTVASLQPVKAQTAPATVVSYSWYIAPNVTKASYTGDLVVVGEIQNTGSSTIGSIGVVGFALDSSGQTLAQQYTLVYGSNIAPNQKAPFYIDFQPQNSITQDQSYIAQVSTVNVYVTNPTEPTTTPYNGLTVSGVSGTSTVTGTLKNTGDQTVGNVWVVATFYNSSGTVIGVGYSNYLNSDSHVFPPGSSVSFSVSPHDADGLVGGPITSTAVIGQYLTVEQSRTPTPAPSTTTNPNPSYNPTTNPNTSTGPSAAPFELSSTLLLIIVVVALAVVIVILVVVMIIFIKRRKATPAQSAPSSPPATPPA